MDLFEDIYNQTEKAVKKDHFLNINPNIKNDQKDWVESVVRGFCDKWNLLKSFQDLHAEEQK